MDLTRIRVGVLGIGAMGTALARGWIESATLRPDQVLLYDVDPHRRAQAPRDTVVVESPGDLIEQCQLVWLAVKPKDLKGALSAALLAADQRPLLVSIAAGVSLATLHDAALGSPLIRVMPNTPALVGAGASAFARGPGVTGEQAAAVWALLAAVGTVCEVPETLLNAVTGVSGSGPAYAYLMIEALADGGVRCGLPREIAQNLAAQTLLGAAKMVLETGDHPGALKDRVASPGGTTIAGLAVLEAAGLRSALIEAVTAAARRADELG